jgi:hypothetical protein
VLAPVASAAPAAPAASAAALSCHAYTSGSTAYVTCSSGPGTQYRAHMQCRNKYDRTTRWVNGSWRP